MTDYYDMYVDYRDRHQQRQLAFARSIIEIRRRYLENDGEQDLLNTLNVLHGAFMMADTDESMHEIMEFKKEVTERLDKLRDAHIQP